jgi:hypothetical protein
VVVRRGVGALVLLTVAMGIVAAVSLTNYSRVDTRQQSVADPFSRPPMPSDGLSGWRPLGIKVQATCWRDMRRTLHACSTTTSRALTPVSEWNS